MAMVALAAAACGTTVPSSQLEQARSASSGLTTGGTSGALPDSSLSSGGVPGSTVVPGQAGGAPGGGSGSTTGAGTGTTTGAVGPSSLPTRGAAPRGPVVIGALTANGAGKYQKSLGFSGATGDQVAMTQSVVSYLNAHGGLGGRKIQLVSYDLDPAAVAADQSTAMQAACTYFTQDHKVAALASYVGLAPESFYQCLAHAHVPVVTPDEGVSTDFLRRLGDTLYMPQAPSYSRMLTDSVDALWDAGWLTSRSIVGVVGYDTVDVHDIVDKGLVVALQRHGLKLTTGLYTGTTTAAASEYNSGVLSFKTRNVDRVFFAPGGEPVYFALAAEQQAYHPRYELSSLEYFTALAANLPADQLSGSMGLGWLPFLDLPSTEWAATSTPGISQCRQAMAAAKQDFSSGTTLGIAAWICDEWVFLRDAFAAGAGADEAAFRSAVESLGTSFRPASTFRTAFGPARTHDGVTGYRMTAFQDACTCYRYTSPVRPLP